MEKCNRFYPNKFPIPYFEKMDFKLGTKESKKTIVGGQAYIDKTYIIPKDLKVYVISAEPGNFWKVDCKENRPETLKDWKNGYSRGIAISEKEHLVVFWVMIW